MILLDTNVISEPTKLIPSPALMRWLDQQDRTVLFLSSVSVAEVWDGVEKHPEGRRRVELTKAMSEVLQRISANPVLPFDEEAALAYPKILAKARANRYTVAAADAFIAATALARGLVVATRDVDPFLASGVPVLNPWEE